jgi:tetratricopeptide (TPR) repeat protein
MDRITRKSLKDDRFAAEVTHSVEFLARHRRQSLIYGGIALAVVVLVIGMYLYRQNRRSAAHEALYKALETYRALVTEEERPGRVTFRTQQEKNEKALRDFQAVVNDFSGTEATVAGYYLGLVYRDMGQLDEAQKQLEEVISRNRSEVASLARLALAEVYVAQNKPDQARQQYDHLLKNPTTAVPESRTQLEMARFLGRQDPAEARKLLEELSKRTGTASVAANAMLRELGPQ